MQGSKIDIDVILVVIAVAIELAVLTGLMFGIFAANRKKSLTNFISTKIELPIDVTDVAKNDAIVKLKQSLISELEKSGAINISEVDAKSFNLKTITASISIE